ncbi:MAG: acyl-CoA dehydrogenase family protein [Eubacteriaceae bacterium]|nr:acyl-CoA dehydrogenase family protein [Eubacteriaceae bacterium]
MDFGYSKKQLEIKKQLREFCEKEVAPQLKKMDENAEYPLDTVKKLGDMGFMGMPFPKEYGGMGLDYVTYVMAIEEISKISPSHGVIVQTHNALSAWPIFTYGTEKQKKKYLPDMLSGKKIGAFGLTEPNAGTDAAMQQTTAEDGGDCWILNGSKMFISGAGVADVYVIMAMTDKSKGNKGISSFIVEKGTPGFTFGTNENKMGIGGSTVAELLFNDCRIPKDSLLHEEGKGFKVAMSALDVGRLGVAAQALGIAQGAFDMTVKYMNHREQFGKPISSLQALAFEMAEMETEIEGARFLLYRAADVREKGEPNTTVTAAKAKLACASTAMKTTVKAVQFHGGYGYMKDMPLERYMRDAKITEIYEGTSEVMKLVISGSIFGRPKKHEEKETKILNDPAELIEILKPMKDKDMICSGGRGLEDEEGFDLLGKLADKLGAERGASRGAVRAGLADEALQVGLTGRKVAPEAYIAAGISGMTQHLAGMKNASIVVAINKNPKAPIFEIADYGIIGDAKEIIKKMI